MSPEQLSLSFFFFFLSCCSLYFFLPPFCVSSNQRTTPPYCNFCVTHFTNAQKLKPTAGCKVSARSVTFISVHFCNESDSLPFCFFLSFLACVLLFQLYLGFLLSLLFDLFSPSSLSLGPWQLLSQCFPPRASGIGGWVEGARERGRDRGNE